MKRIYVVALFLIILLFGGLYKFVFKTPFEVQKMEDGWFQYTTSLYSFEYPNRLIQYKESILPWVPSYRDRNNQLWVFPVIFNENTKISLLDNVIALI